MSSKRILFVFLILVAGLNIQAQSVQEEKNWGLATLSVSNMRALPGHSSELVSQALMGTPLKVLDHTPGWYKVQTPDEYVGWMDSLGLARLTPEEMNRWKMSNRYLYNQISGNVWASPEKDAASISDLVLGDLFEVESESKRFIKIRIPDGRTGFVNKSACISWNDWTGNKPDVKKMLTFAKQLLGSPYLWGGTSCKAMDCSGLTRTAYFSQGIILARDASQQALFGEHPDFKNISSLQPGDLLFFGRNADRITHVGLYLENGRYIHASGLVQISSVDPNDPAYNVTDKKDFVAASRILNSLNTDGITLVKNHPWYSVLKHQ